MQPYFPRSIFMRRNYTSIDSAISVLLNTHSICFVSDGNFLIASLDVYEKFKQTLLCLTAASMVYKPEISRFFHSFFIQSYFVAQYIQVYATCLFNLASLNLHVINSRFLCVFCSLARK